MKNVEAIKGILELFQKFREVFIGLHNSHIYYVSDKLP